LAYKYGLRHSQPSFMPSPTHYRLFFFFLHLKALVDIFHTDVYSVSAVKQCIPAHAYSCTVSVCAPRTGREGYEVWWRTFLLSWCTDDEGVASISHYTIEDPLLRPRRMRLRRGGAWTGDGWSTLSRIRGTLLSRAINQY
jgi:hypothetical protein